MQDSMTTGEVSKVLGVPPYKISSLFYRQKFNEDTSRIVGKIRLIPCGMLPQIKAALGLCVLVAMLGCSQLPRI